MYLLLNYYKFRLDSHKFVICILNSICYLKCVPALTGHHVHCRTIEANCINTNEVFTLKETVTKGDLFTGSLKQIHFLDLKSPHSLCALFVFVCKCFLSLF